MPQVDFIVVLKDGKISEMGGYQSLIEQNGNFAEFLRTYINEMDDDSSDEGNTYSYTYQTPNTKSLIFLWIRKSSATMILDSI